VAVTLAAPAHLDVQGKLMAIQVVAEQEFLVGTPIVFEEAAPNGPFVAVFEDDRETGYSYTLDTSMESHPFQDVVHIKIQQMSPTEKASICSNCTQ
jgi:hypothetical protein